nr:hypothetical protein CFP56_28532 [Quercus suber]
MVRLSNRSSSRGSSLTPTFLYGSFMAHYGLLSASANLRARSSMGSVAAPECLTGTPLGGLAWSKSTFAVAMP